MKMPKAWLMLASALNPQLGWGAEWKGVVADLACMLVLHLLLETTLWSEGKLANILLGSFCLPQKFVLQFTAVLYAICVNK